MCGIVGAIAERNVLPILLEGLRRLEYRGYDSAGVALIDSEQNLVRVRSKGKVSDLQKRLDAAPVNGNLGIAHTRWATHGKATDVNAHPHVCRKTIAVVHNGIIENHQALRQQQLKHGHVFTSQTDTEVIAHAIHDQVEQGKELLAAVVETTHLLQGAFALAVISITDPERMIVARRGSPLVIGVGVNENYIASDVTALLPVTQKFIILEEGDIAEITRDAIKVFDTSGNELERHAHQSELNTDSVERGKYRHFMEKEIHEQPAAIQATLEGRISDGRLLEACFGTEAAPILDSIDDIKIVACGTSYHAGLIARHGFEELAGVHCSVEVASEFRYRRHIVSKNTLFVSLSQSGETADTLAALRIAKKIGYKNTFAICNVPESSLVRESDLVLMTRAGPEIGVASTKAFTTQLVALLLLIIAVGRRHEMAVETEKNIISQLVRLPERIEQVLLLDTHIKELAKQFADKNHALFLGRGPQYPVAKEGALKLKEISYIHAEAYPAGELKHGPLALVDANMPVVAVAPNDKLLEKLKANLEEVSARGGKLIVFSDVDAGFIEDDDCQVIHVAPTEQAVSPIIYSVPLQLLAYHVAIIKGTDIDQPRNLAKSVTVE